MTAHRRRLEELAAQYTLPGDAPERLAALLEALKSAHVSLTTVRDPREGADTHIADSLSALEVPGVRDARAIADLGSGAGFPGLVLAVAVPEASVTLVESVSRKAEWLNEAAVVVAARNVSVVPLRAEEWKDGLASCDLVTARALAPLGALLEYAAPLLREGGRLLAWKGRVERKEARDAKAAGAELGMEAVEVFHVKPWPEARDHTLHLWSKVRETPPRFPRRAGMARKRPLEAST